MNSWLKKYRILFLVLVLSVTIFIIPKLTFDDSLQNWVPADSEIINDYKMDPGISRSCAKLVNGIWRPNISLKDGLKDTIKSEKKKVGL